jgi:hypothetical protein
MLARTLIIFGIWLSSAFAAECCTIPVFRYALDRWEADKFHLVLPASASQDRALNDLLRPLRANGKANLDIQTSKDTALAQAELRFSTRDQAKLWSGKVDANSLPALLDSPARKAITEHILAGDSIVWVVADPGSPEDEAHAQRIEKRLKFLEQVAALPIQDPNDPDSQLGPGPPLNLKFTLLRLRSDDPAEQMLIKMLAGPKGAVDPAKTSFAAAVFGRGRVLGAWPLDAFDDTALEDACMFLVGRCSCRLKNENPGWDVLMNVDWPGALETAGMAGPPLTAAASLAAQPQAVITKTAAPSFPMNQLVPVQTPAARNRWPWVAAGGALILGLAAMLLLRNGVSRL